MTRKRRYLSSVALNSRLYAIGGYDASSRLNTVECFDPSTAQWSVMTPMLQRRGLAGATTLAGIINAKSSGTVIIVMTGASITSNLSLISAGFAYMTLCVKTVVKNILYIYFL